MKIPMKKLLIFLLILPTTILADSESGSRAMDHAPIILADSESGSRAMDHAPIGVVMVKHFGVMAEHSHEQGGSMISVRQGYMEMSGNIYNGNSISVADILAMPNPLGNMPTNLSVVPTDMEMKMTMVGAMYTPTDKVTLMVMGMFMSKDMNLNTYQSMMNRDLLGTFSTSSSDISDVSFSALIKLKETGTSRWHGELTLQQSVGDNDSKDTVLTPMGINMEMILPYGMQSGDGASRLVLGITNVKKLNESMVWGNQLRGKFIVSEDDWSFGDQTEFNSWLQYELNQSVSLSSRLKFAHQDKISGNNSMINAPTQTANPANYGGKEWHLGLGINLLAHLLPGESDRFGLEFLIPIQQEKNNLQMETDHQIIFGYQKSF